MSEKKKRLGRITILVLSFLLASFAGWQAVSAYRGEPTLMATLGDWVKNGERQSLNVLLLGTDERGKEQARSDTIILAHIDFEQERVTLLSVPRDTRAAIPGHGVQKINHAHTFGGPALLTTAVEGLLGMPVDYYVETNFQGFQNSIDQLGGISIDVEKRMYTPLEGIDLQPGLQKLNGHDALGYVRFRHDAMGDIGRVERQQKFFRAAYEQFFSWRNVLQAPYLIEEIRTNVKTDMPTGEMIRIGRFMSGLKSEQLSMHTLPGRSQTIQALSYWLMNEKEWLQLRTEIAGSDPSLRPINNPVAPPKSAVVKARPETVDEDALEPEQIIPSDSESKPAPDTTPGRSKTPSAGSNTGRLDPNKTNPAPTEDDKSTNPQPAAGAGPVKPAPAKTGAALPAPPKTEAKP